MNQTTAPPPEVAIGAPPSTLPLIRPLEFPVKFGRLWTAGLDEAGSPVADWRAEWLRVTPMGHYYGSTDKRLLGHETAYAVCRGCGLVGTFDPDHTGCPHPATSQDVASALLVSYRRPAPATPRGLWIGVAA